MVNVAEYLFTRLRQLGCTALHGLPGDFNLLALDYVVPSGITWVSSCNELNAAYAADAYGRIRGLAAVMTTFGVGELSAINGIAGSFAELVPVVHIVGTPNRASQQGGMLLHHTLGNGDFKVFHRVYSEVTISQADLQDPETAPQEIDRVLQACYVESRPVYIQLPTDMVEKPVNAELLKTPIDVASRKSDPAAEDMAVDVILGKLYQAQQPALLVDAVAERRRLMPAVNELISRLQIPIFVTPMGKGLVDESLPTFAGVYAGEGSHSNVQHALESSDLVVTIGNIKSDLNTAGFTYHLSKLSTIDIHYNHVDIGYATFDKVYFKSLVPRLVKAIDVSKISPSARKSMPKDHPPARPSNEYDPDAITHAWLWPRISSYLREGDILVTDTGTSYVGYWETTMPKDVQVINQILWSSIGYGVGAAQGAALAAKEDGRNQRTICFEGDGSFQLTVQELSTIIAHDLNVTMFLIENGGYTIERYVHGLEAHYNDRPQWKYSSIPQVLAPESSKSRIKTWDISSRSELDKLLQDPEFAQGRGLQLVEMHMPKLDAPQTLIDFGRGAAARTS